MSANRTSSRSLKWAGAVAILVALSAYPVWYALQLRAQKPAPAVAPVEETHGVACLGRIQPEDGVIHVAGPYIWGDSHAPRVESLKVREGDEVRRGQALAVFVGRANLEASVAQAQAQIAKARRRVEQTVPLRRYGTKDELADLALFLCSDAAAFITGAVYCCDGGLSLTRASSMMDLA